MAGGEIQCYWDFGDGTDLSYEQNPTHIYQMAGDYLVRLTVIDEFGNEVSTETTIYVYDYDYELGGVNASLPDKCYRIPVRAGEGFGVSEYKDNENPGQDWLWPPANTQIGKGYDDQKREIALVLDSKTQREYQINDFDVWTDRDGTYEGRVIKSEIHQKAHHASEGEHVPIRHIEHHEYFKSFDRKNLKNATGYDSEGLPLNMRVDNEMYEDEEPIIPTVTTKRIPLKGDIVFQEKVEGRNLQLRSIVYGAPYWLSGVTPNYETVDKSGVPELRVMSEDGYQENLTSLPYMHVSRNYNPMLNLATGEDANGTHAAEITGPDGRTFSAIAVGAGAGNLGPYAITPDLATVSGDFTVRLWINNLAIGDLPLQIMASASLSIEIHAVGVQYQLHINHNGEIFDSLLDFEGGTWTLITVTRSGLTLTAYENKDAVVAFVSALAVDIGNTLYFAPAGGPMSLFDMCVLPRALNENDIEYYYDDVIRGGEQVLPPF